jgi:hypothetical protein
MKLRPHHFYCFHFASFYDPSRGEEFKAITEKRRQLFKAKEEKIEVKEGPDLLCEACPYYDGQGCTHPKGDEKAVKKWDTRILQELGLGFGQILKVAEVQSLIREKAPLTFCLQKCPYYRENKCNPEILPEDLKC